MTRSRRLLLKSVALLAVAMYGLAMPKAAHAASTYCGEVCVSTCSPGICDYATEGLCPTMEQCGWAGPDDCGGTYQYRAVCI